MNYFFIILIAISLSMDAFSLALSIGTLSLPKGSFMKLSTIVGVFHFFMPLLGSLVGSLFIKYFHVDGHLLSSVIFFYIAIMMFKDFINDEVEEIDINIFGMIIFAFGVSLDSFGVGVALQRKFSNLLVSFAIFTISSFSFTYIGLKLGSLLNNLVGKYSILLGSSIMIILAIINLCQFLL